MIYRHRKIICRYRKFDLPISVIRFTDIGKSADLPISDIQNDDFLISVNQNYFPISCKWISENDVELPISVIRISDIGKSTDLPISENKNEFPISVNRFSDTSKSSDLPISENDLPISEIRITNIWKCGINIHFTPHRQINAFRDPRNSSKHK